MDIEKIKNYTQKVLALVLTALIAFAAIGLISLLYYLFTEVFNFSRGSNAYVPETVKTEQAIQNNDGGDAYKLHVLYNFPTMVDTINQLYIIPVGYKAQYEIENSLTKRGKYSSLSSTNSVTYDYYSQESYVNLLIYDARTSKLEKLFKQPIIIGQYTAYSDKSDVIIVFEAAEKDSNKDGVLSLADETSLFFYSLTNKTMKRAKMEGLSILQYSYNSKFKNAMIRFGQEAANRTEKVGEINPGTLCKYDYALDLLVKINDEKLNKELETIATVKK